VQLLVGTIVCFVVAAAVGLSTTWYTITRGTSFDALSIGTWRASPKSGTTDIDPYARANVARSGRLPIGLGDGVSFIATTDDSGRALDGRCDVVVAGTTPQARFWTLTLYDPEGQFITNSLNRQGFTSQELIRNLDGTFEVAVAPRARPGNWLPTGGAERYVLALRLYDTPVGIATRAEREAPMPSIKEGSCE
jgi:hypothetical protein